MVFNSLEAERMIGLNTGANSTIDGISKTTEIMMIWMVIWTLLNWKFLVLKNDIEAYLEWKKKVDWVFFIAIVILSKTQDETYSDWIFWLHDYLMGSNCDF